MVGEKYLDPAHYDTGKRGNDNETWCTGFNNDNFRNGAQTPFQDKPGVDGGQRYGSAHSAVWQMAFCDGHVESLTYDVDEYVHRAASNRHDGTVDAESYYSSGRPAAPR